MVDDQKKKSILFELDYKVDNDGWKLFHYEWQMNVYK